jgi:hypothetical protein
MATLTYLREYVWAQTQTVESELSTASIDAFLQEAFNRTIAMENQWPFYEKTWGLEVPANSTYVELPGDANPPAFTGLFDPNNYGIDIELLAHNVAQEVYAGNVTSSSRFFNYSIWNNKIHLWPQITYDEIRQLVLTGFRKSVDWIAVGPDSEPDCDERLHRPLAHYAIALAYAQQEDEQLEANYMKRWELDVQAARSAIMEPSQDRPLIMGPHYWTRIYPHRQRPIAAVNTAGLT